MTRFEPWRSDAVIALSQMILNSYRHWMDVDLVSREGDAAEQAAALYRAPFIVVAHGTEHDPVLCYGNAQALKLWEMDWQTLTRTPSRETAEPTHRDERAELLSRTTANGFVDNYRGIRISSTGQRFFIEQAIVWNLRNHVGEYAGQAATFSDWSPLDPASVG